MIFGSRIADQRFAAAFVLVLGTSSLAGACGGGSSQATCSVNACLKDENNYTASGTLTVPHVATGAGADVNVCWSGITSDILCHDVAPGQIVATTFLRIPDLTEAEITKRLTTGTFEQKLVNLYLTFWVAWEPGATCAVLSKFKFGSRMLIPAEDYLADPKYKYMLLFAASEVAGEQTRSMVFLDPTPGLVVAQVDGPNGCGDLAFTADLTTPKPLSIPAAGPWLVDWSGLTKDGLGNTVTFATIDSLVVGYYDMTVAGLEKKALDYDRIATVLYTVPIDAGATHVDLASATTSTGQPFTGFTAGTGFWAIGLRCSTCQLPAPIAVAIVNPT
jgi:hypothetical protein